MYSFPSGCTCLYDMLDCIYKATAVLCPSEKYIKILSFCDRNELSDKKLLPQEFVSALGNMSYAEEKRILNFISGFFGVVPVRNSTKKCCFSIEERRGIFVVYTLTVISDFSRGKYFLTVEKSEKTNDTITFMFKKNAVNVRISDIIYVDYGNHSVEVHTVNEKLSFFSVRFEDAAQRLLEDQCFLRSYKNCIVNMDRIVSYDEDSFMMENNVRISIPKRRKKDIIKAYNDYLLMK